jgi:hypothetical protein
MKGLVYVISCSLVVRHFASAFCLIDRPRVTSMLRSVAVHETIKMVNLPPRDNMTDLEREFRDKISAFAAFSEEQIESVANPRLRALYEGVAASAHDPDVYRAFEVLFEDLVPLRMAGRMIFSRLAEKMEEQTKYQATLIEQTGLSREEVSRCRMVLDCITGPNHDYISVTQLEAIASIVNDTIGAKLHLPKTRMSQENLLLMLSEQTKEPSKILQRIERKSLPKRKAQTNKFEERYEHMVQSFFEWQKIMPEGEGRRFDVLKGCFVGAKNEKVVEALKIVYVDYAALRLAGDLIFKLVSALVSRAQSD